MRKVLYILGGLEDSDLQWLLDAGAIRRVSAGVTIIEEGAMTDSLFIVIDGEFRVAKGELELARLGSGEVVGDMSLLDSRPPSATVMALGDGTVFAIPQAALHAKLERDPQFGSRFYRALCIFLANRLTRADAMIGAEVGIGGGGDRHADEISPNTLDSVALAGARFNWFLQEVRRN